MCGCVEKDSYFVLASVGGAHPLVEEAREAEEVEGEAERERGGTDD